MGSTAPHSMTGDFPRRGEIWEARFPDDPKPRPALIVSTDARNEFAHSVLAVPITARLRPSPTHVPLHRGEGGLLEDSVARCENVTLIRKSRLFRAGYSDGISVTSLRQVEACLLPALGIPMINAGPPRVTSR
ncbi:MAG: type II toxin-antitoxin system PemK/MazF family toxin [Acidobacteriota bacterium]